jgi:cold shock CspA family protein
MDRASFSQQPEVDIMQGPLELSFRDVDRTDELEALVRSKIEKLERVCNYLMSARVTLERHHRSSGNPFRVRVEVGVAPGHRIVGTAGDKKNIGALEVAVRNAFDAVRRQLAELAERQRNDIKEHPEQENQAIIATLVHEGGYGFLRTPEGREIYFHRNSVLNDDFDQLSIGTLVRFAEGRGEKGSQARTVQVVDDRSPP